jgi:hypothetical protein
MVIPIRTLDSRLSTAVESVIGHFDARVFHRGMMDDLRDTDAWATLEKEICKKGQNGGAMAG